VLHAEAPPVGLDEVNTLSSASKPDVPTTAQNDPRHEIPLIVLMLAAKCVHADAPPVGFVEAKMFPPAYSPATHSDEDEHPTACKSPFSSSIGVPGSDHDPPALIEVHKSLFPATAQNPADADGHETP